MSKSMFSEVKCWPKQNAGNILGNGSFIFGGVLKCNFTLIKGKDGPFISLPQTSYQKDGKTEYKREVSLIDSDSIKELSKLVMAVYEAGGTPSNFTKAAGGPMQSTAKSGGIDDDDSLPF